MLPNAKIQAERSMNHIVSVQKPVGEPRLDKDTSSFTEQLNLNGTMNENMLLD